MKGKPSSTLIDMERRAINRMKFKQQKEIEKMLEAEFHRKAIEKKNEEKEKLGHIKEAQRREAHLKRAHETALRAQVQEEKRRQIAIREAQLVQERRETAE